MTTNETIDGLQEIIDRNQKTILPRVHIGYLIHAVKYLKEQKEEIENLKQTAQSMMEGICLFKEQEAVALKPHYIDKYGKNFICGVECGNCGAEISATYKFCPYCGRAVKWE